MSNPPYESPLTPSNMATNECGYGYRCGGVVPGTRNVTGKTRVGDVANSNISNVGNSVEKLEVYRK